MVVHYCSPAKLIHQVTGFTDWETYSTCSPLISPALYVCLPKNHNFSSLLHFLPSLPRTNSFFSMIEFQALLILSVLCLIFPQTSWNHWCIDNFFMKSQIIFHNQKSGKRGEGLKTPLKLGAQHPKRGTCSQPFLVSLSPRAVRWGIWISTRWPLWTDCSDYLFFSQDTQHLAERGSPFVFFYTAIAEIPFSPRPDRC